MHVEGHAAWGRGVYVRGVEGGSEGLERSEQRIEQIPTIREGGNDVEE